MNCEDLSRDISTFVTPLDPLNPLDPLAPLSRNIFLYWTGNTPKLIRILRNLMYLHEHHGQGCKIVFLTPENLHEYIQVPPVFAKLSPNHQSDFIRCHVLYK